MTVTNTIGDFIYETKLTENPMEIIDKNSIFNNDHKIIIKESKQYQGITD